MSRSVSLPAALPQPVRAVSGSAVAGSLLRRLAHMVRIAHIARIAALLLICCAAAPASAHKPSDSYLMLTVDGNRIDGQWDIALRDLDDAIGLDGNGDGVLTWDELQSRHAAIAAYALARLQLADNDGKPCAIAVSGQQVDHHTDGAYTVLHLAGACPTAPQALNISYRAFADTDPQHKGLLRLEYRGAASTAIFGVDQPQQTIALAPHSGWREGLAYLRHGVWHIWTGYDHLLFLLTLLLPAVLTRERGRWRPAPRLRPALADIVKTVSAFTVAHSITLALAVLGVVALPSRWVESAIAASVVAAALNNLFPVVHGRRWLLACAFGLLHGFGFAGVLADLGLPPGARAWALGGFNLGVELGQLAMVALFIPLAYHWRASAPYRRLALHGGSLAIALLAAVWLTERAFAIQLLPTAL